MTSMHDLVSIPWDDFLKGLFTTGLEHGKICVQLSFPVQTQANYGDTSGPVKSVAASSVVSGSVVAATVVGAAVVVRICEHSG